MKVQRMNPSTGYVRGDIDRMTQFPSSDSESIKEAKLPRRDWILLPLLGLLTICLMVVCTEAIGTRIYPRAGAPLLDCLVLNDPSTGIRGIPHSACWSRLIEGPLVESRFNGCGHREVIECGTKPASAYRIVLPGSSVVFGLGVPRDKTFAALLPGQLCSRSGRNVELYNAGMVTRGTASFARQINQHFDRILAAHPDMILWIMTPLDVEAESLPEPGVQPAVAEEESVSRKPASFFSRSWEFAQTSFRAKSIPAAIDAISNQTRTVFLLRHLLYESQSLYVKSYLMSGDDAGFLRSEPNVEWQNRLQQFESDVDGIEEQSAAAGIPFVAVLIPNRAQAAMISMGEWPAGYDPYKLDKELRGIVTRHGGTYLDILQDYRDVPNPERGYFPVDGHPNADGHAMISRMLAKELTSGVIPELRADGRRAAVATSK